MKQVKNIPSQQFFYFYNTPIVIVADSWKQIKLIVRFFASVWIKFLALCWTWHVCKNLSLVLGQRLWLAQKQTMGRPAWDNVADICARRLARRAAFTLSRVPPPGNSSARPIDISMCDALWSLNPPRKAAGVCMRVSGYVQARKMLFLLSQHHHPARRLEPSVPWTNPQLTLSPNRKSS